MTILEHSFPVYWFLFHLKFLQIQDIPGTKYSIQTINPEITHLQFLQEISRVAHWNKEKNKCNSNHNIFGKRLTTDTNASLQRWENWRKNTATKWILHDSSSNAAKKKNAVKKNGKQEMSDSVEMNNMCWMHYNRNKMKLQAKMTHSLRNCPRENVYSSKQGVIR